MSEDKKFVILYAAVPAPGAVIMQAIEKRFQLSTCYGVGSSLNSCTIRELYRIKEERKERQRPSIRGKHQLNAMFVTTITLQEMNTFVEHMGFSLVHTCRKTDTTVSKDVLEQIDFRPDGLSVPEVVGTVWEKELECVSSEWGPNVFALVNKCRRTRTLLDNPQETANKVVRIEDAHAFYIRKHGLKVDPAIPVQDYLVSADEPLYQEKRQAAHRRRMARSAEQGPMEGQDFPRSMVLEWTRDESFRAIATTIQNDLVQCASVPTWATHVHFRGDLFHLYRNRKDHLCLVKDTEHLYLDITNKELVGRSMEDDKGLIVPLTTFVDTDLKRIGTIAREVAAARSTQQKYATEYREYQILVSSKPEIEKEVAFQQGVDKMLDNFASTPFFCQCHTANGKRTTQELQAFMYGIFSLNSFEDGEQSEKATDLGQLTKRKTVCEIDEKTMGDMYEESAPSIGKSLLNRICNPSSSPLANSADQQLGATLTISRQNLGSSSRKHHQDILGHVASHPPSCLAPHPVDVLANDLQQTVEKKTDDEAIRLIQSQLESELSLVDKPPRLPIHLQLSPVPPKESPESSLRNVYTEILKLPRRWPTDVSWCFGSAKSAQEIPSVREYLKTTVFPENYPPAAFMLFVALTRGWTWSELCTSKWQCNEDVSVLDNIRKIFRHRHDRCMEQMSAKERREWERRVVDMEHKDTIERATEVIYKQWKTHGCPADWWTILPLLPDPVQSLWAQRKTGLDVYILRHEC